MVHIRNHLPVRDHVRTAQKDQDVRGSARVYVPDALEAGASIWLPRAQTHYLNDVLRLPRHAPVRLFNGRDGEWLGELAQAQKKSAQLDLRHQTREQTRASDLWLIFVPVKAMRGGWHGRKAAELGVSCLQPVLSCRSVVRRVNGARLEANAIEGAEQCGSLHVPEIGALCPLSDLLDQWEADRQLFFFDEEAPGDVNPLTLLAQGGERAAILIGPEGGFAPEERERLRGMAHVHRISLGSRILCADSAVIAALSLFHAARWPGCGAGGRFPA